jgi:hypothetical protein
MPPPPSMAREESYGSAPPPPPPPPPPPMMGMGMGGGRQMDNDAPPPLPTGRSPAAMAMMAAGRAVSADTPLLGYTRREWGVDSGWSFFIYVESQLERFDRIKCASCASTTSDESCG